MRRRLHKYFSRVPSPPHRPHRARWFHEPLESRLLLSADVLPAEEVLTILGTEADDSVEIRTIEPETGGAPQLLVNLNGRSFTGGATSVGELLGRYPVALLARDS